MRLKTGLWCAIACALPLGACGSSDPEQRPSPTPERPPPRETVFDPLTSTIGRAQGVQQTVDEQAAEQRRRIEEAAR